MKTLPDKFSECIRVAVADLEKAEASPHYRVDMGVWHRPGPLVGAQRDPCVVCFAGAVMAGTLGVDRRQYIDGPEFITDISHQTEDALRALDHLRGGGVQTAYSIFSGFRSVAAWDVEARLEEEWAAYEADPAKFKRWALLVSDALAEVGL